MKLVYLVLEREPDDTIVIGVFGSKERADRACKERQEQLVDLGLDDDHSVFVAPTKVR